MYEFGDDFNVRVPLFPTESKFSEGSRYREEVSPPPPPPPHSERRVTPFHPSLSNILWFLILFSGDPRPDPSSTGSSSTRNRVLHGDYRILRKVGDRLGEEGVIPVTWRPLLYLQTLKKRELSWRQLMIDTSWWTKGLILEIHIPSYKGCPYHLWKALHGKLTCGTVRRRGGVSRYDWQIFTYEGLTLC